MEDIFEIVSHVGAKPLLFGMTEAQVESLFGSPSRVFLTKSGERNAHYETFSIRYSTHNKGLVEIGLLPTARVTMRGIDIFRDSDAFEKLVREDGCPYESYGFIVLLNLGITLTGFHDNDPFQLAVTAFERGRWDHLRDKLKAFRA